ncbi:hypothetical protein KR018_010664 [Drosophila ironensis]|nr:hypothetical protein KR018_010664 [Drosophila ironensis]
MLHLRKIILILLLSPILTLETPQAEFKFLSKLLRCIRKYREVQTIYMLQHQETKNCSIENWHPRGMAMLRATELSNFQLKLSFNDYHTLGLICITRESEIDLLDKLSKDYEHMRQERIILWIQIRISKEIVRKIEIMSEKYYFTNILMVEVVNPNNNTFNFYRLNYFPEPKLQKIEKMCGTMEMYPRSLVNFQGKAITVLPPGTRPFELNITYGHNKYFPINSNKDLLIIEFARQYNLTLKRTLNTLNFDLPLSARLIYTLDYKTSVNPFVRVSVVVIVPCGKEHSVQDIFKRLDFEVCVRYLLPVYLTFVAVESLILVAKNRLFHLNHRFNYLDPILNMRAICAILGFPFPVSRKWNLSLRQLLYALTVFGFVFSNFFACKLSAQMTKHLRLPHIKNLEELEASKLPVLIQDHLLHFINTDVDPKFISRKLPNYKAVTQLQLAKNALAMNNNFCYVFVSDFWSLFDNYQNTFGQKSLCHSQNLTIISNLNKMYFLPNNSIFLWPLRRFSHRVFQSGILNHWAKNTPDNFRKLLNVTIDRGPQGKAIPLCFKHFNWLWILLLAGFGLSTAVFILEMFLGAKQK